MKTVTRVVVMAAFCAVLPGCPKKTGSGGAKGNSAAPKKNPAPARPMGPSEVGKWKCAADSDCLNSCKHGAVSRKWYRDHGKEILECSDGCNNQISGPPRCLEGGCVAFDNKGMRRAYCTRKHVRR